MKAISGLNQFHVNSSYSTWWRPFPRTVVVVRRQRQYGGMSLSAFPSAAACRLFTVTWSSACPLPPLPPPPSPSLFGYIPVTAPLSSSTPPAPHCSVRSPALFVQMEQKRKWKPESTVNPFLGLCSTIVCIPVVFPPCSFHAFDDDLYTRRESPCWFFSCTVWGGK